MDLFKLVGSVFINTSEADSSIQKTTEKAGSLGESFSKVGDKIKKTGDSIAKVGSKMTKTITAPIVGLGTLSVKNAANFESAMNNVSAISGAVGEDLEKLSDLAQEMGKKTKFSASESADAMSYMAMAGWKTQDMLDGLEGIMNLAAASGEDLATTSDIVTDALTAFGLSASDSSHFADVLAATSSNANTNVSMLGETFKYAAPIAGALGYTVEDTAEAIGLMANAGIKSSQAGTSLRSIMTSLQGEIKLCGDNIGNVTIQTTNADGTMRSFSDILSDCRVAFDGMTESEKATSAQALVGKNAMSGFLAIMNASETDINKLSDAIDNADGTAANMAETMENGLNGQLTKLKSATEAATIQIGQQLTPYVEKCVTWIQNAVEWFSNLNETQKQTAIKVAVVVAAIGPLLLVIGKTISFVGKLVLFAGRIQTAWVAVSGAFTAAAGAIGVSTAALGGIIAAVVAVIAIGVLLYKNWDKIKEMAAKLGAYLSERWTELKEDTAKKWGEMKEKAAAKFEELKTKASKTIENLKASVKQKWEDMKTNATTTIDNMKSSVKQKFEDIKSSITDKIDGAKKNVKDAIDKIKGFFNFSFKWPKLTLPHFKATGGEFPWGMLGQGKAPKISVEWYAKAMDQARILTDATPFAVSGGKIAAGGEAGNEVVSGEAHLIELIQGAVGSVTADLLSQILEVLREMNGSMYDRIVSALQTMGIKFDERELARLVRKYA